MSDSIASNSPAVDLHALVARVKAKAHELGFDLVGISSAEASRHRDYFRQWLDDGQAGTMNYLSDRFAERTDPATFLPGARSVICVAINYHAKLEPPPDGEQGRIARYALGDDYHEIVKDRLYDLADWLRADVPGTRTRCGVDTVPVMEKELAARAGIGWLGKNTCVINEQIGSWILLGEVLTTLPLPVDESATDRCGSCTRCIDACPTGAITAPYQLDARRCISYLTIEHRDSTIPNEFNEPIGDWLYGCDICQDVCPWNSRAPLAIDPSFLPRFLSGSIDVNELLSWTTEEYRQHMRGSAIKRVKLPVLQRNARIVHQNKTRNA